MKCILPCVLLLAAACDDAVEEQAPFQFFVHHQGDVLVDELFTSYSVALASGPYMVEVVEGTASQMLTIEVGYCMAYECAGPITREVLDVWPSPPYPSSINAASCVGLDGWVEHRGIDGSSVGGRCDD